MELYDIVVKLAGKTAPIGESHIDCERFESLTLACELIGRLLDDIDKVASMKNMNEQSVRIASTFAENFLKFRLGIE